MVQSVLCKTKVLQKQIGYQIFEIKTVQISNKTNCDLCLQNVGIKGIFDPETVDIQRKILRKMFGPMRENQ